MSRTVEDFNGNSSQTHDFKTTRSSFLIANEGTSDISIIVSGIEFKCKSGFGVEETVPTFDSIEVVNPGGSSYYGWVKA